MIKHFSRLALWVLTVAFVSNAARAGEEQTFASGSLIIPMDLAYQDHGMFQSYGLIFQLLRQGVSVYWVIDLNKSWHAAACDTQGDECAWDCAEDGSGLKCPYPTASPDFYVGARVIWDGEGQANPGDPITLHGYRGGPFVIDAADAAAARPIIDAWNDQGLWADNPWAQRTEFHVVSVHETTEEFTGYVRKKMVAAPTIAVFSDGNEDIATSYLRAAGIPQSNGLEFPAGKCGANDCGPGTDKPDMLTVESIMGDMGTCDNPNLDHQNGALFTTDGVPAYCQIMSMHWNVNDREKVECQGGCPATQAECSGQAFTYHGHEVVAEVRKFLNFPVHFFAECQAVNAYENTVPNPAWPYLDDSERIGHYLTDLGTPPDCTNDADCTDADFECDPGFCDNGTRDCCQSKNIKEKGAGFLIAARPDSATLKVFHPEVPYNQMDGAFGTVGGSEPAYNLSDYLGTGYKNDIEVTFISGPDGPGDQDVWMTGYLDGECDIIQPFLDPKPPAECETGKVSYLGGHRYNTNVPLSSNTDGQGTRMFLNALFEADCVTSSGQPDIVLELSGETTLVSPALPAEGSYTASFTNVGAGTALDAALGQVMPQGAIVTDSEPGGTLVADGVEWEIGSIGSPAARPGEPPNQGGRWAKVSFADYGDYLLQVRMRYRVGVTMLEAAPISLMVKVVAEAPDGGLEDGGLDAGQDAGGDAADAPVVSDAGDPGGDGTTSNAAEGCGCASHRPGTLVFCAGLLVLLCCIRRRR
ncbi:MAG TPA: hypothetical protein VM425_11345 [Myxococcota bacterium]|nr:hypothetical protein [Myxococcota bacterium]